MLNLLVAKRSRTCVYTVALITDPGVAIMDCLLVERREQALKETHSLGCWKLGATKVICRLVPGQVVLRNRVRWNHYESILGERSPLQCVSRLQLFSLNELCP